jgi:hypothetical protein
VLLFYNTSVTSIYFFLKTKIIINVLFTITGVCILFSCNYDPLGKLYVFHNQGNVLNGACMFAQFFFT